MPIRNLLVIGLPIPRQSITSPTPNRLDNRSIFLDISVMTEITKNNDTMPPTLSRFVLHWGEMGQVWGVNRSVSQVHALLYLSDTPLTAEDIASQLQLARSNVSNSLKELINWRLIRRVSVFGDRRDHFEAEADMFEMVRRIAEGRKAREIDPTLSVLRQCTENARKDRRVSKTAQTRLASMLDVVETVDRSFEAVIRLPTPRFRKFLKLGSAITRLVTATKSKSSRRPERA